MKTFVFDNNYKLERVPDSVSWYLLADSALTNKGKPFFIPDFAKEFVAIPVIAIKLNRLGKSVSPKFAERYFSEYAPAIHFQARDLLHRLKDSKLAADRATSFDRSFIMGDFYPVPEDGCISLEMTKNGEVVQVFDSSNMTIPINELISRTSEANTLKIGDLLVPALPEAIGVEIGDVLELVADGSDNPFLSVQIK